MKRDDLHISEPCSESWSEMSGTEQKRFCGQCSKHVHDLSAMTEPEARQVIETVESPCVRYSCRPDGTVRFKPSRRVTLARAGMIAGGLMIGMSAAGSVVPQEDEASSSGVSLLERISDALWSMLDRPDDTIQYQGGIDEIDPEPVETSTEDIVPIEEPELHVMGGLMAPPDLFQPAEQPAEDE